MRLKYLLVLLNVFFLGCSVVHHNANEYKHSPPHTHKLVIPSNLDVAAMDDYYPVPKVTTKTPPVVSLKPPRVD